MRLSVENIESVLIQWGQWALDMITLLISLLSCLGQFFHNFQNKPPPQLPFPVYLILVYLPKENYFAYSYFLYFNHKLCLHVSLNLELIYQRIPEQSPIRASWSCSEKKNNWKTRGYSVSRSSYVCLDFFFFNGGII